ncbi:MAG: hypothetical protein KC492_38015, partial [Myxococcales bacterium]|nr:hypothetical protein [Myxococcales bacterium]
MTELPDQSLESLTPADEPGASPLALAAIVGGVTATLLGWTPLRVWSIWWHLAMGRLIDHFSAVPVANHTLYTMPERAPSWVQAWLGQRLLFWSHEALGIEGVLTTRALLFGAAMALAVRLGIGRSATTWQGLGCAALGLTIAWWGMVATPVMYVAPVFVLLVFLACQGDLA